MDLFHNSNRLLKLFVEFLGAGQSHQSMSPARWEQIEKDFGKNVYPDLLFLLTQKEFTAKDAKTHWFRVLDHQETLNKGMGRDLGFQVAMVDYFTNIHPVLGNLVFVDIDILLRKERASLLDELTGLYNRRFFERILKNEEEQSKRYNHPFSILLLHVDHLGEYYQAHGRQAGDRALAELARVFIKSGRTIDHTIRYGPDEFIIILPRCKKDQARAAAERHRQAVEIYDFPGQEDMKKGNITVTIGVSTYPVDHDDGAGLLPLAASALKRGLRQGRNRVVAAL